MFSFYQINTYTKLLRIGTQQYSPFIYCRFRTVFSPQTILLYLKSQVQIYTRRRIASEKQGLERKCVLQESSKTVRRRQRSILLVKEGHCIGDCKLLSQD